MDITCLLFLLVLSFQFSLHLPQIHQTVFLNPKTNSTFIQCPLHFTSSLDIQWYDVTNQRYDPNRGRYYRIHGLQSSEQELICSSVTTNEKFRFIIQIHNRPLPIQYSTITKTTNTSLTIQWKDNQWNQYANITSYELILKYDQLIQSRILVNHTLSTYTFSSLHPNTFYSIDISVIDRWKRSSPSKTILSQTLPFDSPKKALFNQIIDQNLLDQSIACFDFHQQFLFIEFNQSKFQIFNHIYTLTIFNTQNAIIFSTIFYSSLIYSLKTKDMKYKIQLIVSTNQSEYLGKISKDCEEFYPVYSPLICSIRLNNQKKYQLMIYKQKKQIDLLQTNEVFYRVNGSYSRRKNINQIHHFIRDEIIDVKENYSIIIENDLLDDKFNISIICPLTRIDPDDHQKLSNRIIICLIFLILILIPVLAFLAYKKLDHNRPDFDSSSIPIDQFSSYVDGYEKINAYIVTQAPMVNTRNDFWRMIWEKDVSVIVMMTNLEEDGNSKYDIYWPEEKTEIYGEIEVTLIRIDSLAYYKKRIFSIQCTTNQEVGLRFKHPVHQFHYTDWPDQGVPLYPLSFLSFVRRSSVCHSETGGPMVVHCSAGVDRAGTYIVIDTMLKRLNKQQTLDIPLFLKHIRQQRYNLVQTEEQFNFIYDLLFEVVELEGIPQIEKQFQFMRREINERSIDHPLYLHGYYRVDEFIITSHPRMKTKIDFWKMIWNNQTNILVGLYSDENFSSNEFHYWPSENQMIDCGNIQVYLIDEHFECDYIYRDCLLRSTKDDRELRVKIISTSYWPDTCSPIETSFHLINTIRNLNSHRPIVVHDHLGGYRAGTFCALYTMKEQIENEGILNVYELAKFYSIKRPGIWRDSNDLLLLYRCAEILIREYKS